MSKPQGWTWVTTSPAWHYFIGEDTICGKWYVDDLAAEELEQQKRPDKKYCKLCQRKIDKAALLKVPIDGALTEKQREYLAANWATKTASQMAAELGIHNPDIVASFCNLRLPAKATNAGAFKKGLVPHNKGLTGYCAPGSEKGWFKKGHESANSLYDGAITTRPDNRGVPQLMIRISKGKWEYLSRHLWQQAHGPIPEGHMIAFRDKNTQNCTLENLELITMAENLTRNNGRRELTDKYVAYRFAQYSRGKVDIRLRAMVLNIPQVLEAKRQHIILNRTLQQLKTQLSQHEDAPAN